MIGEKSVKAPKSAAPGKMSPRKRMAGADGSGAMRVENPWSAYSAGPSPHGAPHGKMLGEMERGTRPSIKYSGGMHLAQAAPNHGPHFADYGRAKKGI